MKQYNQFDFKIIAKDKKTKARVGEIHTSHGVIKTPAFVAVGTKATVKSMTPGDLEETGTQLLFGNTYHLHLMPGEDIVKKLGGLGSFMGWKGPTITDSGGFQVFSLGEKRNKRVQFEHGEAESNLVKVTEDGVKFRSYYDGSLHTFTPEVSIDIQKKLGADLIIAFDQCPHYPATYDETKKAMDRTHRWAVRSLISFNNSKFKVQNSKLKTKNLKQAIYGVVQGGVFDDLRKESAKFISSLDFDGIAIGGVAVGESKQEMRNVLDWVGLVLPENKPRHLLGIGEIDDMFDAVEKGMDTFDCVVPTRVARTGYVFIHPPEGNRENKFRLDLMKSRWADSKLPADTGCNCYVCQNFTRGYLNHLFKTKELLAYHLATRHNLYFFNSLIREIRESIIAGKFLGRKKLWLK
jgi:queuine tRNA-ribosyltransferase